MDDEKVEEYVRVAATDAKRARDAVSQGLAWARGKLAAAVTRVFAESDERELERAVREVSAFSGAYHRAKRVAIEVLAAWPAECARALAEGDAGSLDLQRLSGFVATRFRTQTLAGGRTEVSFVNDDCGLTLDVVLSEAVGRQVVRRAEDHFTRNEFADRLVVAAHAARDLLLDVGGESARARLVAALNAAGFPVGV